MRSDRLFGVGSAVLEVRGVRKSFIRRSAERAGHSDANSDVLGGISFELFPGEVVGVLGPNGSGKSTMFGVISGLITPDEGEVWLEGKDVRTDLRAAQQRVRKIGIGALGGELTPLENVMFVARLYGTSVPDARQRATELLGRWGLPEEAMNRQLNTFSTGQQQLVSVARAVASFGPKPPALVLMDEPSTGLDVQHREMLAGAIDEIRAMGTAVLVATHDMRLARRVCRRAIIFCNGRIVSAGSIREIRRQWAVRSGNPRMRPLPSLTTAFVGLTSPE